MVSPTGRELWGKHLNYDRIGVKINSAGKAGVGCEGRERGEGGGHEEKTSLPLGWAGCISAATDPPRRSDWSQMQLAKSRFFTLKNEKSSFQECWPRSGRR